MDSLIIELEENMCSDINYTYDDGDIKDNRYNKYEKYVDDINFDNLMLRLVYEPIMVLTPNQTINYNLLLIILMIDIVRFWLER